MKLDLSKLFELSARTSGAISIACMFLLFFPSTLLPFDIEYFRVENGMWIFTILVITITIWASFLITWTLGLIKDLIRKKKIWDNYKYILKNLSDREKICIKGFYDKRETAIYLNLSDPIHKKLQTFQIFSITVGNNVGSPYAMPGFIQPWVFELIDKNPQYLEIINKTQEEQTND